MDDSYIVRQDSADRHAWHAGGKAHHRLEAQPANRRAGFGFGRRDPPGPDTPVGRPHRAQCFDLVSDRRANQEAGRDGSLRQSNRQIIRPEVDAVGSRGDRHVQSVIDQDRDIERGHQSSGSGGQFAWRGPFEPKLNAGDSPADRRATELHKIPALDQTVIGHQDQPRPRR